MISNEYHKIAINGLQWIKENQNKFSLPPEDHEFFIPLIKPLGELALTAEILIRNKKTVFNKIGWEFINFCWAQLQQGDLLCRLLQDAPGLIILASIYPTFWANGLKNTEFETSLHNLVTLRSVARLELPAWRALELAIAFQKLNIPSPWLPENCYKLTWLFGEPEPWVINASCAYSLTHTVFYLTEFGKIPSAIHGIQLEYLRQWVPMWTRYYFNLKNYDLLSEMIMVLRCISEQDDFDWSDALKSAQLTDGMFPGPSSGAHLTLDNADDYARQKFLDNYHTTLVAVMASVMSLN